MRTKKLNTYWCEFCRKHGLSASHIAKHEKHCTGNPNRKCRMCDAAGLTQKPMAELVACLPTWYREDWIDPVVQPLTERQIVAGMKDLIELADGCPACILAAMRQRRIPHYAADWDFREAAKSFWSDVVVERHDREEAMALEAEVSHYYD